MRFPLTLMVCGALAGFSSAGEVLLVGGDVMNGNFNAPGGESDTTYASTPYWVNLGTSDEWQECLKTNEDFDGTHNAVLAEAAGRLHGVDTGYTIQEGDVFDIGYQWKDSWQWTDAGDQIKIRLFITDDDTIGGAATDLVSALSGVRAIDGVYEAVAQNGIYTASDTDAGKKLFVAIDTHDGGGGADGFARVDDFELSVHTNFGLAVTLLPDDEAQVNWNATPGCYYAIEESLNLTQWDPMVEHFLADEVNEQTVVTHSGGDLRFLRIRKQFAGPMADAETPAAAQPLINVPSGGKWMLDFSDEFNGASVDTAKWNINDSQSSRAARPTQGISAWYWKPNNVSVTGGNLVLDVTKQNGTTMWCGSINSNNKYEPTYGFMEARIEIADTTKSTHTAFWTQGDNMGNVDGTGNDGAELDIFESAWTGDYTKSVVHIDGYGANHQADTKRYDTPGLHSGFHVFGAEWNSSSIKIYYDGMHMVTYSGIWVPQVAEYLWISDGASFGDVGTFASEPLGWLTSAKVDYVRFWKKL